MTSASERLAALRARTNKDPETAVAPKIKAGPTGFEVTRWFDKIRAAPTAAVITQAGAYYDEAVRDGAQYVVPVGNLQTLLEQHPGVCFFYQAVMVDVQQSRRWVEEKLERLEAAKGNYYMYDDAAKAQYGVLKVTEAGKLAKADPEVTELAEAVRLLAFHEHNMERLMAALDNIKYVLNHIVTIRKEKLEEVWVDATKETTNA
jgi:hypothetical protein